LNSLTLRLPRMSTKTMRAYPSESRRMRMSTLGTAMKM
jgi:hypothetical protein